MRCVLVDSSVWIDFFRRAQSSHTDALARLVRSNRARITDIVRVELLSGCRSEPEYHLLETRLTSIPVLTEPADLWNRVARARFRLARKGFQTSIPDLCIAILAQTHSCTLLTLDRQFRSIARVVPLRFYR